MFFLHSLLGIDTRMNPLLPYKYRRFYTGKTRKVLKDEMEIGYYYKVDVTLSKLSICKNTCIQNIPMFPLCKGIMHDYVHASLNTKMKLDYSNLVKKKLANASCNLFADL